MIRHLEILNFKSVKKLKLDCKKVNVFIGEPNSGKSNIIEAMSLQSQAAVEGGLNRSMFRFKTVSDLFHDFNVSEAIQVFADRRHTVLRYELSSKSAYPNQFHFYLDARAPGGVRESIRLSHEGSLNNTVNLGSTNVRYYQFKRLDSFSAHSLGHLSVSDGSNLPMLLLGNADLKKWVTDFLKEKGLMLTLKPVEMDIQVSKLIDGTLYSYPYSSISETLQRVIFYEMAIASNKDSVLLFDEPETNTFPFYTKYLAERIALDESNQFFLTTHNPYLLLSLIEKTPFDNLNVILCQMKDYQTEATVLNKEQVEQVLDLNSDVFFNFDQLLGK